MKSLEELWADLLTVAILWPLITASTIAKMHPDKRVDMAAGAPWHLYPFVIVQDGEEN